MSAEYEALLNALPEAAILADAKTQRILLVNQITTELTGYTRAELIDVSVKVLFPQWDPQITRSFNEDTPDLDPSSSSILNLSKRFRGKIPVRVMAQLLPPKGNRLLIRFSDISFGQLDSQRTQEDDSNWSEFVRLIGITQKEDLNQAIHDVIKSACKMAGCKEGVVYIADTNSPILKRVGFISPSNIFPDSLPTYDLISLKTPDCWLVGKRTTSNLQQIAQSLDLAFLATAPIGYSNASIGLIGLADHKSPPPTHILQIIKYIAEILTLVFELDSHKQNMVDVNARADYIAALNKTYLESIQEGLIVLSKDLEVIEINPAAEIILGYNNHEVQKQPYEHIVIGSDTLLPSLRAALDGNPTYNLGNIRLFRRYGEQFIARVRIAPILSDNGVTGIFLFIKDLTEQEQIREQTTQLEQRALLGEVTAIVAHEVRNPINNISTGLELMSFNLPENDPNQQIISRMQQDCDRLSELIKSILSYARPTEYVMESVDIRLLLQRLMERTQPRITSANIQYHLQTSKDCPPVRGNPRALEQVFSNLISNSVQAMSETGGELVIKTDYGKAAQEGQGYLEVRIIDTGPGIPKELQEKIFQPFYTTKGSGTGLGLAIAKRIITAHKGVISLESFPGGTIFQVRLPVETG